MVNRHNNFVAILIIINNCQSGRSNKETKYRPGYIYTFSNFTIRVRTRLELLRNKCKLRGVAAINDENINP